MPASTAAATVASARSSSWSSSVDSRMQPRPTRSSVAESQSGRLRVWSVLACGRTPVRGPPPRIPPPPHDRGLRGLPAALDGDAMRALLADHVAEGCELVSVRPAYVRYKPGTSCLVQYEVGF